MASLSSLSSLADSSARYKAKLSADSPLQVTLSKKSLSLIKDTAEVNMINAETMCNVVAYNIMHLHFLGAHSGYQHNNCPKLPVFFYIYFYCFA